MTFRLDWDVSKDLDMLFRNDSDTAYVCSFGAATGNHPENASCTLPAGTYIINVNDYAIARNIERHNIQGLLMIGGWTGYEACHRMVAERQIFPAFKAHLERQQANPALKVTPEEVVANIEAVDPSDLARVVDRELVPDLVPPPEQPAEVLHPLEVRDGDAARVGQDVGQHENAAFGKDLVRLQAGRTVGTFGSCTLISRSAARRQRS